MHLCCYYHTDLCQKIIADESYDPSPSYHIPLVIQALNDNFDPATFETSAAEYNTIRYADFIPKNCPASAGNLKPSDLDGQTIIPSSHKKFIPVFDKPKYCPFGLGYRRCPAEIFNYFFTGKLMQKIGDFLAPSPYTPGFIFTTYSVLASLDTQNPSNIAATVEQEFTELLDPRGVLPFSLDPGTGLPVVNPAFDKAVPKGLTRGPNSLIVVPRSKPKSGGSKSSGGSSRSKSTSGGSSRSKSTSGGSSRSKSTSGGSSRSKSKSNFFTPVPPTPALTKAPSATPSKTSDVPSTSPSESLSIPSTLPSDAPSAIPSEFPSDSPSAIPSEFPTATRR